METLDNIEILDAKPKRVNGHGGRRAGAGQKSKDYVPPPEKVDYDKAKARSETAKAALAELEFAIKSKQYVERATVAQVQATAYAAIAQTMRSIPDNLERKGVAPEVCEQIGFHIDDALNDLADQFKMFSGDEEGADDAA